MRQEQHSSARNREGMVIQGIKPMGIRARATVGGFSPHSVCHRLSSGMLLQKERLGMYQPQATQALCV